MSEVITKRFPQIAAKIIYNGISAIISNYLMGHLFFSLLRKALEITFLACFGCFRGFWG